MSRRTSQSSISLFPFLAVLVCTMGALILLLLVTTRRIRNDQVRWTERFQVTARVADENGLTKVTDEADFVIEPKRDVLHDGLTEEQRRELTALREQLQAEQEKYDQLQEQLGDSQSQLQVALDDREALRDRAEKLAELRRKEQQIRRTLEERAAELAGLFEQAGLPFAPIRKPEELYDDPHLQATAGLADITLTDGDRAGQTAQTTLLPFTMDGERLGVGAQPPHMAENTNEVLASLGYTAAEAEALRAAGAVA